MEIVLGKHPYPQLRPVEMLATATAVAALPTPTLPAPLLATASAAPTPVETRPVPTKIKDKETRDIDTLINSMGIIAPGYSWVNYNVLPVHLDDPQYKSAARSYCLGMIKDPNKVSRTKGVYTCFMIALPDSDLRPQIESNLVQMRQSKNPQQRITSGRLADMLRLIDLYYSAKLNKNNFKSVNAQFLFFNLSADPEIAAASQFLQRQMSFENQ